MMVLVLDDDVAFVGMVRSALVEDGHGVVPATDGGAGLDRRVGTATPSGWQRRSARVVRAVTIKHDPGPLSG